MRSQIHASWAWIRRSQPGTWLLVDLALADGDVPAASQGLPRRGLREVRRRGGHLGVRPACGRRPAELRPAPNPAATWATAARIWALRTVVRGVVPGPLAKLVERPTMTSFCVVCARGASTQAGADSRSARPCVLATPDASASCASACVVYVDAHILHAVARGRMQMVSPVCFCIRMLVAHWLEDLMLYVSATLLWHCAGARAGRCVA